MTFVFMDTSMSSEKPMECPSKRSPEPSTGSTPNGISWRISGGVKQYYYSPEHEWCTETVESSWCRCLYDPELDVLYLKPEHYIWNKEGSYRRQKLRQNWTPKGGWKPVELPAGVVFDKTTGYYHDEDAEWYQQARRIGPKGHVWRRDKFWAKDDPNLPPPIPALKDLGLAWASSVLGCGTRCLVNWYFIPQPDSDKSTDIFHPDNIIAGLKAELEQFRGRQTGIILAVVNPAEHAQVEGVLLGTGFVLLKKFINYNHNHPNYLYGWVCEDHANKVEEVKRSF